MSQKKDELRHAIQEDFERMGEVVKSLSQLQTRITRLKDPALIRMTVKAAAGELHDYYTAFEFIAKRVLMLEGITIDLPEGRWHKALSQAAVKHQLVSEAHMPLLDDKFQQSYQNSHRIFHNLLFLKNVRQFCGSRNRRMFTRPILGA